MKEDNILNVNTISEKKKIIIYVLRDTTEEAQCQYKSFPACFSRPQCTTFTLVAVHKHMSAILPTLTHTHTRRHTHSRTNREQTLFISLLPNSKWQLQFIFPPFSSSLPFFPHVPHWRPLCGEADAAALHADLQAVRGLAAGVHDAAVHVTRAAAVVTQIVGAAAAAAAGLGAAGAAGGLCCHHVAQRQELAGQTGQDAVDAAVWGRRRWEDFEGNIFWKLIEKQGKTGKSARTAEWRGQIFAKESQELFVSGSRRNEKISQKKKNYAKPRTWDPAERKKIQRTAPPPPHQPPHPSVLINGLLNNCSIIMQTARLITQETISHKSKRLSR